VGKASISDDDVLVTGEKEVVSINPVYPETDGDEGARTREGEVWNA
jgi:hypothetical protein